MSSGYVIVQRNQAGEVTDVFWPDRRLYTLEEARGDAELDRTFDIDGYTHTVAEVFED